MDASKRSPQHRRPRHGIGHDRPDGIRVRSPRDLIEVVPLLLGYRPGDSIVLVALDESSHRIGVMLRLDLAAIAVAPDGIEACVRHVQGAGCDRVLAVVYTDDQAPSPDGSLPYARSVAGAARQLRGAGLDVIDVLLCAGDRWWSYECVDRDCCPPQGHSLTTGQSTSAVAAAATVAGLTAVPDRATLAASVAPLPADDRRNVHELAMGRVGCRDTAGLLALWRRVVTDQLPGGSGQLRDADAADLLAGLQDIAARDGYVMAVTASEVDAAQRVAVALARRASSPFDAAAYTVLSWLCWRRGDGSLARIAVERALRADGAYRLALLIEQVLDAGIDPRTCPEPLGSAPSPAVQSP